MNRKSLVLVSLGLLLVLSLIQILIDKAAEANLIKITSNDTNNKQYIIFIEIEDKTLYLLENGICIKEYTISSGMSGLPSPIGVWKIIDKGDWGEGFGGRWMGLDVPWGIYGIHGTTADDTIGSAASHGCIRMFNDDIAELYSIVPLGTEVTIANGIYGPFGKGFSEIYPGDRGADVLAIQYRLRRLGYYKGELDGIYEDDLKNALHRFQRSVKLPADNTIDRETWLKMGFMEFE